MAAVLIVWTGVSQTARAQESITAWGIAPSGPDEGWWPETKTATEEPQERAPTRFTPEDVHQAARASRHPREVGCIFKAEVGGYGYDPYVVHADKDHTFGPGGLATYGLLPQYRAWGYVDPYDPYTVAEYIDRVIDEGRWSNWRYLHDWMNRGLC